MGNAMKPLTSDDYSRYKTRPVPHEPWNPYTKIIASKMMAELTDRLQGLEVEIIHMGSTALEIAGKNEVELYVYPAPQAWAEALQILTSAYGKPGFSSPDFIRFNSELEGFEIEIMQMRGYVGRLNKAVYRYLSENPELCEEYVDVKRQYCCSKREYQRHKDLFFEKIVRQIPDDDPDS